jgi:LysM repeat protein
LKLSDFKQNYFEAPVKNTFHIHIVSKGDNLSYIGKLYGVPYKMIMDFNNLKTSQLKLKQKLIIPATESDKKISKPNNNYYTVQKGDSLGSIALEHKLSVQNLKTYNNLQSNMIKIGDKLKLYE